MNFRTKDIVGFDIDGLKANPSQMSGIDLYVHYSVDSVNYSTDGTQYVCLSGMTGYWRHDLFLLISRDTDAEKRFDFDLNDW